MKTVEARQGFCPLVRHKVAPEQGTIPPPLLHKPGPVTAGVLGSSAQTDSHCETASGSGEDTERSPPVARPVIIYVTHDQVEAMTMADRVLMMVDGRIEQLAAPDELYRAPATTTVARFIGSPPMNIINFDSDSELSSLAPSPLRDHGGALGVRPERLRLLPIATASVAGHEIELGNATILVNELLGADRIIAAELSGSGKVTGQHVVARVAPEFALDMDDQVVVVTEREAIHWYAPDTGRRVEPTTDQHIEPGTRRPVAQQTTTVPQPSA